MAAIAFVGDSFCASFSKGCSLTQGNAKELTYLDIVTTTNRYDLYPHGYGGRSWWFSRQRFLEDLERIPKDLFEKQLEVIVFCHTNSGRINNAWNQSLDHTDATPPELQNYYRYIFDGDFNDWAQQAWFKEISERWSHIKTIHFHCFPESVKWSNLLPGMVYTTPLMHVSVGELQGTEQEIDLALQLDTRYNHLSTRNNQILAEWILGAIYDYKPGQYEIDINNFDIVNPNSTKFPQRGYGTK